jgi:hypothetical protein
VTHFHSPTHAFLTDVGESFQPSITSRESHTPLLLQSPELLLDSMSHVTFVSEIWNLACAIFFVMGQRPLFESWFPNENVFLDEHTTILGRLPEEV